LVQSRVSQQKGRDDDDDDDDDESDERLWRFPLGLVAEEEVQPSLLCTKRNPSKWKMG